MELVGHETKSPQSLSRRGPDQLAPSVSGLSPDPLPDERPAKVVLPEPGPEAQEPERGGAASGHVIIRTLGFTELWSLRWGSEGPTTRPLTSAFPPRGSVFRTEGHQQVNDLLGPAQGPGVG
jgi:hypothetical protein